MLGVLEAIALDPKLGLPRLHRADLLKSVRRFPEAIRDLNNILAIPREQIDRGGLLTDGGEVASFHAAAYRRRGDIHAQQESFDLAEADFNAAVAIEPNVEYLWRRGNFLLSRKGRALEALRNFRAARALAPENIRLWHQEAEAMLWADKIDEGIAEFGRIVAVKPDYAPARMARIRFFRRHDRVDDAMAEVEGWFRADPAKLHDLIERMAAQGMWRGERFPETMTPALREAFLLCIRDKTCG